MAPKRSVPTYTVVKPPKREEPKQGGTPTSKGTPKKKGGSPEQNALIAYAWELTHDANFIRTIEMESGWRDIRSHKIGANGCYDFGYMQLNYCYHKSFIESKEFADPKKQIEYGWKVYSDAINRGRIKTTFYGWNRKHLAKSIVF